MPLLDVISRLRANLLQSGLQKRDNPLFQVINQLIGLVQNVGDNANIAIANITPPTDISDSDFLVWSDETATLPNSRNLLAGPGITFDDTIANERTISSAAGIEWSVLTNWNVDNPELIFVDGDVIMVHTP